jgi:hypothetical protein
LGVGAGNSETVSPAGLAYSLQTMARMLSLKNDSASDTSTV